jgi:hypothetical protein
MIRRPPYGWRRAATTAAMLLLPTLMDAQASTKPALLFEGFASVGTRPPPANGATNGGGGGMGLSWVECVRETHCDFWATYSAVRIPMTLGSGQRGVFSTGRTDLQGRALIATSDKNGTQWWRYLVWHVGGGASYLRVPITPAPVRSGWFGTVSVGTEWAPHEKWQVYGGQLRLFGDAIKGVPNPSPAPFVGRIGLLWRVRGPGNDVTLSGGER